MILLRLGRYDRIIANIRKTQNICLFGLCTKVLILIIVILSLNVFQVNVAFPGADVQVKQKQVISYGPGIHKINNILLDVPEMLFYLKELGRV